MADGGHSFVKKTFHKPTYCHHCSDLLWGLIQQGYICEGEYQKPFILLSTRVHSGEITRSSLGKVKQADKDKETPIKSSMRFISKYCF